jgi:hypothetical protein
VSFYFLIHRVDGQLESGQERDAHHIQRGHSGSIHVLARGPNDALIAHRIFGQVVGLWDLQLISKIPMALSLSVIIHVTAAIDCQSLHTIGHAVLDTAGFLCL